MINRSNPERRDSPRGPDHIAYAATAAAPGEDDVRRFWPEIFEYRPETFEYQVRDPLYA